MSTYMREQKQSRTTRFASILQSLLLCMRIAAPGLAWVDFGCANHQLEVSGIQAVATTHMDVLDVQLGSVDIENEAMPTVIFHIGDKIAATTGIRSSLSWLGHNYPPRNFTYHAKHVNVRTLFDALCQQTGWSYRVTLLGIEFRPPVK